MSRRPDEVLEWLRSKPTLAEVRQAYPAEWQAVERRVADLVAQDDAAAVTAALASMANPVADTPGRRRPVQETVSLRIRQYLTVEAIHQAYVAAETGVTTGAVRFGLVGGYLAQKLLFARDLERKPVSLFWFRLVWPLVRRRRSLMPLVRPRGIYCFYSRRLIKKLARLIDGRGCLEIAAGDGTLARFLAADGVAITATDDHSWQQSIDYPDTVLRQSAGKALRTHRPTVVICSWPPAGNSFERQVFETPSVELYIVISTRHELSAGNWETYRSQQGFELVEESGLGRLLLPPENDGAVLLFHRRSR